MTKQILARGIVLLIGILYGGMRFGYKTDLELQCSEEKTTLVEVSENWRPFFHFRWRPGRMVARCALWIEILAYITAAIIILGMMVATIFPGATNVIQIGNEILFVVFLVVSVVISAPSAADDASAQVQNYDLDWVASIQHNFGMLKKRHCRVISEIAPDIYKIRCGIIIRCYHRATSTIPVEIGKRYYAVHNYDIDRAFGRFETTNFLFQVPQV